MKKISLIIIGLIFVFAACEKETLYKVDEPLAEALADFSVNSSSLDNIPVYNFSPYSPLDFSWDEAEAGLGSAVSYTWQLDVADGNFSNPIGSKEVTTNELRLLTTELISFLNTAGIALSGEVKLSWRVKASISDNEKFTEPFVFTVKFMGKTDLEKLYLVGDATEGGMDLNEAAELTKNDDGTYSGVVKLLDADDGGTGFKILGSNTFLHPQWGGTSATGGDLLSYGANNAEPQAIPAPAKTFYYKITVDFTAMTYSLTLAAPPAFYIVGGATPAGWDPTNAIAMTKKDDVTYEVITTLDPDGWGFKFLEQNDDWHPQWGGDNATANGGALTTYDGNNDPAGIEVGTLALGSYTITVDFSTLTYTIAEFNPPTNMYLVGGSTSAGWDPASSIPFRSTGTGTFEIYSNITADGGGFKFLEVQDWPGDWGKDPGKDGGLIQEGEENATVTEDGYYRVQLDFTNLSYTTTKTSWAVTGDATPNGWPDPALDHDMTYDAASKTWKITLDLTAGLIKFRANDAWDINLGDTGADASLEYGGDNINISTAGNYTITLSIDGSNFTYTVVQN